MENLFAEELEQEAITRIVKFSKIAESMEFEICVGFSGGKDSQVVLHLVERANVPFKAYFNHAFESKETLNFIRDYYPQVIWRRETKEGFFENIRKNHKGLLPTVTFAYCCEDYKHNPKQVDACSIVGVRRAESQKRKSRKTLEVKNKTTIKKNKSLLNDYFTDNCIGSGSPSIIQLKPIIDWSDEDVWNYIRKYNLPINPVYKYAKRVGCIICPKASLERNFKALIDNPKLIDCAINSKVNSDNPKLIDCAINSKVNSDNPNIDWIVTNLNCDMIDRKVEYVCRWLNHSFMPFTPKQRKLFEQIKENYDKTKQNGL